MEDPAIFWFQEGVFQNILSINIPLCEKNTEPNLRKCLCYLLFNNSFTNMQQVKTTGIYQLTISTSQKFRSDLAELI